MDIQERINKEVRSEESSVWYIADDEGWKIIIKLSSPAIKKIILGCSVEFLFGADIRNGKKYFHTGIKVHDDTQHALLTIGAERFQDEHDSLNFVMTKGGSIIEFYNELSVCVATAYVLFDDADAKKVLRLQEGLQDLYVGGFTKEVESSMDCFDFSLDKSMISTSAYEIETLLINGVFSDFQINELNFIGLDSIAKVVIDDIDEGGVQENQIWASLETMFHGSIYKNAIVSYPSGEIEFTDIFAMYEKGLFFIESKALTILSLGQERSMQRKVATLQKHIKKAIGQLVGAKKSVDKKYDILTNKGEAILIDEKLLPKNTLAHCIIIISEMLCFGDWNNIEIMMLEAMASEKVYFHVIDFADFVNILKFSQGRVDYFDYALMVRAEKFYEIGNIFIRSKLQVE